MVGGCEKFEKKFVFSLKEIWRIMKIILLKKILVKGMRAPEP